MNIRLKKYPLTLILLLYFLTAACTRNGEHYPPQQINALYTEIAGYATLDSLQRSEILKRDSTLLSDYLAVLGCQHIDDSLMMQISKSKPVAIFTPDVSKVYPTLDSVESNLGYILGAARHRGLKYDTDNFAAVVWGRPQSVVFVDSTMLIALNHYLGTDYPGYHGMPAYRLHEKTPAQLPYDLAESLAANSYPFDGGNSPTLLAHMLYHGALTEIKLQTVPGASLAAALGMSDKQLQWCLDNEANIWRTVVSGHLLYETSAYKIDRIMLPAPSTDLISPNSPGRVGRFIGYRIIEAYLKKNSGIRLSDLLQPSFYNSERSLAEAAYRP